MDKIIDDISELYKKTKTLKEIKIDAVNWVTYYLDEQTGEKWIEEHIFSEMQAGGPPQLRLLVKFPWE
jgi:hypothetical protein